MTRDEAPRRPRTIYLSDELWEALDLAYMEEGVARTRAGGGPVRKTEFIEGILETHLKGREGEAAKRRRKAVAKPEPVAAASGARGPGGPAGR
jgi:hypothetical protein